MITADHITMAVLVLCAVIYFSFLFNPPRTSLLRTAFTVTTVFLWIAAVAALTKDIL